MAFLTTRRTLVATATALALSSALTLPVSAQDVTLTWLTGNTPDSVATAERLVADFEAANPGINIEYETRPGVRHVEQLYLDAMRGAQEYIYIETQYLTSKTLGACVLERLQERHGPEVVLILHPNSDGWLEQYTMDVLRGRLLKQLRAGDRFKRLGLYYPHIPGLGTQCLSLHSKVLIVDDAFVRIGSSNLSNRSMGFDTECDLAVEAGDDARLQSAVTSLRDRLLGEHLSVPPEAVTERVARDGSLIATIEGLRGHERTLQVFDGQIPDDLDAFVLGGLVVAPVTVLIAVSVLAFGPLFGFLYSFTGMTLSALTTFGLGHLLGHETVRRLAG